MTLREMIEKRAALIKEARALQDKAKGEKRDLTTDEATRCDGLLDQAEALTPQIEAKEKEERSLSQAREQRDARFASLANYQGHHVPPADLQEQRHNSRNLHEDIEQFSLLRAIECRTEGRQLSGLELEVSQELEKQLGKKARGFYVPLSLPMESRAVTTTSVAGAIQTTKMATLIMALRERTIINTMGATFITGLVGPVDIPKQTAKANYYWLAEDGTPSASTPTIGQIQLRQKTLGSRLELTRRAIQQPSIDMENFARGELVNALARGVDWSAFNGTGASNDPTGILQDSNVTTVSIGTNGGAPTLAKIVEMESGVTADNADAQTMAYVTSAQGKGALKTTAKVASTDSKMLWEDGELNGFPAFHSTQIPVNLTKGTGTNLTAVIFGDWSNLIVGMWSAVDIMVDPYTLSDKAGVRISAFQDMDIQLRYAEGFRKIVDMTR